MKYRRDKMVLNDTILEKFLRIKGKRVICESLL